MADVTVCPDCRGRDCERYAAQLSRGRTIGMSDMAKPLESPDVVAARLGHYLGLTGASDVHGIMHELPGDTEFEMHIVPHADLGTTLYTAVYSGQTPPQELIDASPVWTNAAGAVFSPDGKWALVVEPAAPTGGAA